MLVSFYLALGAAALAATQCFPPAPPAPQVQQVDACPATAPAPPPIPVLGNGTVCGPPPPLACAGQFVPPPPPQQLYVLQLLRRHRSTFCQTTPCADLQPQASARRLRRSVYRRPLRQSPCPELFPQLCPPLHPPLHPPPRPPQLRPLLRLQLRPQLLHYTWTFSID
ncbi:hypothetical protein P8C59_000086 [Phyllachora maydis]|uniref:Uncharacterized protein n=1 Tax=Phyllachora maydis TaxID=1825666 RepID=A0AAD9M8B5_9PEZI|nr:hypothetical protein P8C59_000086 [Phyllachora maydis]